jgi:hypothetical protein
METSNDNITFTTTGHEELKRSAIKKKSRRSMSDVMKVKKELLMKKDDQVTTNLERSIETLNIVKNKLRLYQEVELAEEIEWLMDVIIRNKFADLVIKIGGEMDSNSASANQSTDSISLPTTNSNSEELQRMFDLLTEFSVDLSNKRSIENLQELIKKKKTTILSYKKLSSKEMPFIGLGMENITLSGNSLEMFNNLNLKSIAENYMKHDFDVFAFADSVGRDVTLNVLSFALFSYYGLFDKKINKNTFNNFIDEVRLSYPDNPYHNVNIFI